MSTAKKDGPGSKGKLERKHYERELRGNYKEADYHFRVIPEVA
jgi:hypothetical protein